MAHGASADVQTVGTVCLNQIELLYISLQNGARYILLNRHQLIIHFIVAVLCISHDAHQMGYSDRINVSIHKLGYIGTVLINHVLKINTMVYRKEGREGRRKEGYVFI